MNSTSNRTDDFIEVPTENLWKRTFLLGFASVSIGLGAGYFLGRSLPAKESLASSPKPPVNQVRFVPVLPGDGLEKAVDSGGEKFRAQLPIHFLPFPEMDGPEMTVVAEEELFPASPSRMPRAWDSDDPIPPRHGKFGPALMQSDKSPPRQSDKG